MPVECYAMVAVVRPLSRNDKEWRTFVKSTGGDKANYSFCHCKLVQPVGRNGSVPLLKWEIVKSFWEPVEEWSYFYRVPRCYIKHPLTEFDPGDFYDAYGDSHSTQEVEDEENPEVDTVLVPDYIQEWRDFFRRIRVSPRKLRRNIHALPYHHPIDDRRVQLRQIKYLFPEYRTMPLPIALDYLRDRL